MACAEFESHGVVLYTKKCILYGCEQPADCTLAVISSGVSKLRTIMNPMTEATLVYAKCLEDHISEMLATQNGSGCLIHMPICTHKSTFTIRNSFNSLFAMNPWW